MSVTLVSMDEKEFENYYQHALEEYANEHVKAGNWNEAEAVENARVEFEQLLPDGLATKEHFLFTALYEGEPIGTLWLHIQTKHQEKQAFIYDIKLNEGDRNRGLGKRTMEALDEYATSKGVKQIRLHVFAHNRRAKALYEKMGYDITDYHMEKTLR